MTPNNFRVKSGLTVGTTISGGNTTITGFVNATSTVNASGLAVGTAFVANSTGAYHTGTVNAASLTVGATFTANATLVNTAAINVTGQVNTATLYAATSANIASAVQANSTGIFTTGTANAATVSVGTAFIANTTRVVVGTSTGLQANGGIGSAGQVLHSNGTTIYWAADDGITSIATANGLSGGPITTTGTIGVTSGSTLTVNTTGIHVNNDLSIGSYTATSNVTAPVHQTGAVNATANNWYANSSTLQLGNSSVKVDITPTTVNAASHTVGTSAVVNSTAVTAPVYQSGAINATANNIFANSSTVQLGNSSVKVDITPTTVNAATFSVGASYTANSTLVNAAAINVVGQVNTATLYAATSANIASAVQANSTGIFTTGTANAATVSVGTAFIANSTRVVIGTATGLQANGGIGTAGQVLTSNATTVYWSTPTTGTVTNIATANGISGGPITSTGTIGVTTGPTLTVNSTGIHVNSTLSITDLTLSGNLTVSGTRTYVNTTTLDVGDNIVTLNADLGAVAPTENAGIEIMRGTSANVQFIWDETNDRWSTNSQPLAISSLVAAGAASGITTLAAGNTTITGFANVTSTIQGGAGLTIAGAASGITTLAAGNTTITGFVNATSSVNSAILAVGTSFVANATQTTLASDTLINNNKHLRFQTVNSTAYAYMVQQSDDNFVFYTSNTTYGQRAVWSIFANSTTSNLRFDVALAPLNGINANGSMGTGGQVLTSNGAGVYWSTVSAGGGGTVTSISTANGLSGGTITTSGTIGVTSGSTLTVNSTGIHVNSALVVDTVAAGNNGNGTNFKVGDDVWIGDINTSDTMSVRGQQSANNGYIVFGNADGAKLGRAGLGDLTYTGAFATTGNLSVSTINATSWGATITSNSTTAAFNLGNSSVKVDITPSTVNAATLSVGSSVVANSTRLAIGTAVGLQANGGIGTAGQVLTSNATTVYWSTPTTGTVTSVATGNGLSGGTITSTGTLSVTGGSTLTVNTTGVHVNSALSITSLTLAGALSGVTTAAMGNTTITGFANVAFGSGGGITGPGSGSWAGKIVTNQDTTAYNGLSVQNRWAAATSVIFEAAMGWNGTAAGYYPVFTVDGLGQVTINSNAPQAFVMGTYANGNVGFGNNAPAHKVSIAGTLAAGNTTITGFANVTTTLQVGGGTPGSPAITGATSTGGVSLSLTDSVSSTLIVRHDAGSGHPIIGTNGSGLRLAAGGSQSGQTVITITSGGNTGFGNTAPTDKLSVNGTTYLQGVTTLAANLVMANNNITRPVLTGYTEAEVSNTAATGAWTMDCGAANFFELTLTGSITISPTNVPPSTRMWSGTIVAKQDATGGRTITWPTGIKWPGGSAPPATTTANATDIWSLMTYDGGTTWVGSLSVKNVA